ncbi:MAG: cysteine desulfurase NifS [Methanosarcinales archaeon]|nr:cysteine desulfurase NifS [Methanosarcinales archaeon]
MKRIYLDHAATTAVDREVVQAMVPYFTERFGNASSLHTFGRDANRALASAREGVADALGADAEEIIFTSGGTESDNLALRGSLPGHKGHIITSSIEHPAILKTCRHLEDLGCDVTYLPVDADGLVDPGDVESAITSATRLISVMHANNEIGTIQPVSEIGAIASDHGIPFHTDAVQSFGKTEIDVRKMNIDMLSLSSHKIYGPKGVGALYIRKGVKIAPLVYGGGHEHGIRAGTENVSGIVGFAKAVSLACERFESDTAHLVKLRDMLIDGVFDSIDDVFLNGHPTKRLPNNANMRFMFVEGEAMLIHLDIKGIAVSTGSACSSASLDPSHVLLALGISPEDVHGSIRFTHGRENTEEEIKYVLDVLPAIIEKLRAISPLTGK